MLSEYRQTASTRGKSTLISRAISLNMINWKAKAALHLKKKEKKIHARKLYEQDPRFI